MVARAQIFAGIGGGCGIEGELADRIGKMIWEAESRSLALGSGANSNPSRRVRGWGRRGGGESPDRRS